jgi:hypothetical protein
MDDGNADMGQCGAGGGMPNRAVGGGLNLVFLNCFLTKT